MTIEWDTKLNHWHARLGLGWIWDPEWTPLGLSGWDTRHFGWLHIKRKPRGSYA